MTLACPRCSNLVTADLRRVRLYTGAVEIIAFCPDCRARMTPTRAELDATRLRPAGMPPPAATQERGPVDATPPGPRRSPLETPGPHPGRLPTVADVILDGLDRCATLRRTQ